MSDMNALVGVDFSLIGTKLRAVYEKSGEGWNLLLIPTELEAESGISIGKMVEEIQAMIKGQGSTASTDKLKTDITDQLKACSDGREFDLNKVIVKLDMAYLYIHKHKAQGADEQDELEYAFQMEVITDGFIPAGVAQIVDVTHLSLSVWSTERKKILEKMRLVTIADYLGIADSEGGADKPEVKG